ncbi:hypothetical protein [Solirubrobacter soli]|uniref:hypothetical protein n=1 Tax=Solirubrobacter soli TaxID=363832 RepID=UPI00040260A5|nr:hypothetical protein [Solirubrobacter soli]
MSALDQLREGLREAAARDIARARRRRRRTRLAAALALVVVGGGAAAEATNLFDSGPAAPDIRGQPPRYAPGQGERRQIVVKLRVDGSPLPYGVALYETGEDRVCAVPGVLNGSELGDLVDGRFRPFAADRIGACNVRGRANIDSAIVAGRPVLFGVAPARARSVALPQLGKTFTLGPDRAFLFVTPSRVPYKVDFRE